MSVGCKELFLPSGKSKLAEVDTLSSEPRLNCVLEGRKEPKVDLHPADLNACAPLFSLLMVADSTVARIVVILQFVIRVILSLCAFTKILISAIERVTVFVINVRRLRADNFAMKKESPRRGKVDISRCVKTVPSPESVPVPLTCPIEFCGTDFGNKSAREWDKAVRLIQRLNNRLARHATLGHGFTSNEVAAFSRIPILATISGAAAGFEEAPCT